MTYTQNIISLYTESTPNPESMKFVVNRYLLPNEIREYTQASETDDSPLAKALFQFPYVKSVFLSNNYVTLLKQADADWNEIIPELKEALKAHLESGKEIVITKAHTAIVVDEEEDELIRRIKDILNDYVQPAVEQDGGAISFHSFEPEQGLLTVRMQGSCSGCPSSVVTLKQGIQQLMTRLVPEVKEVVSEGV